MEKFVLDSPALENAVKQHDYGKHEKRTKGDCFLDDPNIEDGYSGFFLVGFDGQKFSVVDGENPDSGTAGWFYINGEIRSCKSQKGITPKDGWLCLKATAAGTGGEFEILTDIPSKPEKAGKPDYHPIAKITKAGESWSFRQISRWEIPQLWTFEDCESEEKNGD